MRVRVLLAEDHTLVRSGIRLLLENSGKVEVLGEAGDGHEAIELTRQLQPEVVLMDVGLPLLSGIEAARQIHAAQPEVRILMLSMHADRQYLLESLRAGASGYVLKDAAFTELLTALRSVQSGHTYLSPALAEIAMEHYVRRAQGKPGLDELEVLSPREREVLQLIGKGDSSAEIAQTLHISVRTVDTHRHNIMKKLDIHSIAGLTKFAVRHGLCELS